MTNIPVYIIIDASEKMQDESFLAAETALENITSRLDETDVEVSLCVITFAEEAETLRPLEKWNAGEADKMKPLARLKGLPDVDGGLEFLRKIFDSNKDCYVEYPLIVFITSGDVLSEQQQDEFKRYSSCKTLVLYHPSSFDDKGREELDESYLFFTHRHQLGTKSKSGFDTLWDEYELAGAVNKVHEIRSRYWVLEKRNKELDKQPSRTEEQEKELDEFQGQKEELERQLKEIESKWKQKGRIEVLKKALQAKHQTKKTATDAAQHVLDSGEDSDDGEVPLETIAPVKEKLTNHLPVYLLIDVSERMRGTPIQSIQVALENVETCLNSTKHFGVSLCVIAFASEAIVERKLCDWKDDNTIPVFDIDDARLQESPNIAKGLECLWQNCEGIEDRYEWDPLLIFVTSGVVPSENVYEQASRFNKTFAKTLVVSSETLSPSMGGFYRIFSEDHCTFGPGFDDALRIFWRESAYQINPDAPQRYKKTWDERDRHEERYNKLHKDYEDAKAKGDVSKEVDVLKEQIELLESQSGIDFIRKALEAERLQAKIDVDDANKDRDKAITAKKVAITDRDAAIKVRDKAIQDKGDAEKSATNTKWWACVIAACVGLIAVSIASFGAYSVVSSSVTIAKVKHDTETQIAASEKETAEREKKAEEREVRANTKLVGAERTLQKALDEQQTAKNLRETAEEAKREAAIVTTQARRDKQEVERLAANVKRDENAVRERERGARETEARAVAIRREAENIKAKADQVMQDAEAKLIVADTITQEANRRVTDAEEKVRNAIARQMGVEAMISAGAPLQLPKNDSEQNDNALIQNSPVSNLATPKRATLEILRDIVWRWCLEGELGVENESGELIGEITGKPRLGYIKSLQGSLLSDQEYVPPFGGFVRRNLLSPTETTREFWEDRKEGHEWSWEDWQMLRSTADKRKEEFNVPPGYTFSLLKSEIPLHHAKLDRRYMLAQIVVTQELWESVMGNNPSRFKGMQRPVENVTWEDCQDFLDKLNEMKEKLGVPQGYEFTLPWESEWEHACRAGTATPYHFGSMLDDSQANIGKKLNETSVVGMFSANPWGLQDMHGNVREWCQDGIGYGPLFVQGRESLADGFYRSLRGGSWSLGTEQSHSAYRSSGNPIRQYDDVGFRLCLAATK